MGIGLRSLMASAMASALVATFVGRANAQTQSMEPPMAPPPVTSCTYGTSCLSRQPLHFEVGYDPARHLSQSGVTLAF